METLMLRCTNVKRMIGENCASAKSGALSGFTLAFLKWPRHDREPVARASVEVTGISVSTEIEQLPSAHGVYGASRFVIL